MPSYTASSLLMPNESMCQTRRKTPGMATTSANNHHLGDNRFLVTLADRRSRFASGRAGLRESSSISDATPELPPTRDVTPTTLVLVGSPRHAAAGYAHWHSEIEGTQLTAA